MSAFREGVENDEAGGYRRRGEVESGMDDGRKSGGDEEEKKKGMECWERLLCHRRAGRMGDDRRGGVETRDSVSLAESTRRSRGRGKGEMSWAFSG